MSPVSQAKRAYPRRLTAQRHFLNGYYARLGANIFALCGSDAERAGEAATTAPPRL